MNRSCDTQHDGVEWTPLPRVPGLVDFSHPPATLGRQPELGATLEARCMEQHLTVKRRRTSYDEDKLDGY